LKRPSFSKRIPPGEQIERLVCDDCGWVHYVNPKIVVGAVATWEERYLLCLRAIEPRRGKWTIPAGFLEENETTEEGVLREAREEACVELEIEGLLGIYNVARVSQVQLLYKAVLKSPEFDIGEESLDVRLFAWDEIPWDEIAFSSVDWALRRHRLVAGREEFPPFSFPGS
jgi:ADP-ribose pyrophosphatase YjhB (NUDIX family)